MARGTVIGEVDGIYDNAEFRPPRASAALAERTRTFRQETEAQFTFPTPSHSDVPSVQPVLNSQACHSLEIGSVGRQEKCVVDQRRRRDFQVP